MRATHERRELYGPFELRFEPSNCWKIKMILFSIYKFVKKESNEKEHV